MTGRFVTFEGVDGAGKSTHIEWFANALTEAGRPVLVTREPGGSELAEAIRELVLNQAMDALTELLLIFAARRDHLQRSIIPALQGGSWVVCDRFLDSTMAYQGAGRQMPAEQIDVLGQWVTQGRQPDRTYLFDLDVDQARQRRSAAREADRFEGEQAEFFQRVRAGYQTLAHQAPARMLTIDATQTVAQIRQILTTDLASQLAG